jgi:hypothetical protein
VPFSIDTRGRLGLKADELPKDVAIVAISTGAWELDVLARLDPELAQVNLCEEWWTDLPRAKINRIIRCAQMLVLTMVSGEALFILDFVG